MIAVEVHNQVTETLLELGNRLAPETDKVLGLLGAELLTLIRQNASTGTHAPGEPHIPGTGPGPNVATGDYRRSWALTTRPGEVFVFTNAPQAARLEYGFVGPDSLGRVYNQPPYPHVRPAVEQIRPKLEDAMRRIVQGVTQ